MSHLDDWAAALVDSELGHADRDQALAHLAGCADCRTAVDAQRRVKAALQAAPAPAPSADLVARLLAVPDLGAAPVASRPARRGVAGSDRPRGTRPWSVRRGSAPVPARRRSGRRIALSGASAVGAALAVAVLAGGEAPGRVTPPVGTFVVEHTATTTQLPLQDPVAGIVLISNR